jgi:hypothetical protein
MEKLLTELYQNLQKLLTLHRQLLDLLRAERDALVGADVEAIEGRAAQKQGLIDQIAFFDHERRKLLSLIAQNTRASAEQITLSRVAIIAQGVQLKLGEQFRSVQQALSLVISRVEEQGSYNRELVERSLETLAQMKRNILGASEPNTGTYSASGQRSNPTTGARLISREV